jgi:hypothetical protein
MRFPERGGFKPCPLRGLVFIPFRLDERILRAEGLREARFPETGGFDQPGTASRPGLLFPVAFASKLTRTREQQAPLSRG